MENFFSAIKGKFSSEFQGRYLGNIIEHVAAFRPEVVFPIIQLAKLPPSTWKKSAEFAVSTEFSHAQERRADLLIESSTPFQTLTLLVEIKINDGFLDGQLQSYCDWLERCTNPHEVRGVVVLTAYPLKAAEHEHIRSAQKRGLSIQHVYLTSYLEGLRALRHNSDLIAMFSDYLNQEGYAMYQLIPDSSKKSGADGNLDDYNALLSFMVLNFLPHHSGHSRVSASRKIARGPVVFGQIVQNWQLVSDRYAAIHLNGGRRPTVRYFPEQWESAKSQESDTVGPDTCLPHITLRKNKDWGRFRFTADLLISGDPVQGEEQDIEEDRDAEFLAKKVRLEWGQIMEIHHGSTAPAGSEAIQCSLYAFFRMGKKLLGGAQMSLTKKGICDPRLYQAELFVAELHKLVEQARAKVLRQFPELEGKLRLSQTQGKA